MRLPDHRILRHAHATPDLGGRVTFVPEGTQPRVRLVVPGEVVVHRLLSVHASHTAGTERSEHPYRAWHCTQRRITLIRFAGTAMRSSRTSPPHPDSDPLPTGTRTAISELPNTFLFLPKTN